MTADHEPSRLSRSCVWGQDGSKSAGQPATLWNEPESATRAGAGRGGGSGPPGCAAAAGSTGRSGTTRLIRRESASNACATRDAVRRPRVRPRLADARMLPLRGTTDDRATSCAPTTAHGNARPLAMERPRCTLTRSSQRVNSLYALYAREREDVSSGQLAPASTVRSSHREGPFDPAGSGKG